jgi:hypothetical protein
MQSQNRKLTHGKSLENLTALHLRLEALSDTVDDVRSAALVVSNMARYKKDPDLRKLAKDLFGVHSTLHSRFDEVIRELRESLSGDHKGKSVAQSNPKDAA